MDNIGTIKYTKEEALNIFADDLKNHYNKRDNVGLISINNVREYKKAEEVVEDKSDFGTKIKLKFMVKMIVSAIFVVCFLSYKYFPEEIKTSAVINWIKTNYKKDYSCSQVLESFEEKSKIIYSKVDRFVPEEVYNRVTDIYINKIKSKILNFSFVEIFETEKIDNAVAVFNADDVIFNTDDLTYAEEAITTSSAISLMEMDKEEIVAKNISIKLPVSGTVTSEYGARDEVFENVGYHTGVDIANSLNTPIYSATDGVVTKTIKMDKYYGNYIEIENNGVIFKYAHLNQIDIKEGDNIAQGDKIGLMGSTGASTGSHLHFEIKINGRYVDPELLVKIR